MTLIIIFKTTGTFGKEKDRVNNMGGIRAANEHYLLTSVSASTLYNI